MSLPGNSKLGAVVVRYGQELATLAKSDFPRAAAAEQFEYPEARLFVRLSLVQAVPGGINPRPLPKLIRNTNSMLVN